MPHIVPLNGIYRKKKQVKIANTTSSPLFDYQAQVQPAVFDETGLVASYHFNEGSGTIAKDSSPNKNDGTITNGTYVPGQFGTAIRLDSASSAFVSVPDSNDFNPPAALTYEIDFMLLSQPATNVAMFVMNKSTYGASDRGPELSYEDVSGVKKLTFRIFTGGTPTNYFTSQLNYTIPIGQWTHLVVTCIPANSASTKTQWIINGVSQGTGTNTDTGTGCTTIFDSSKTFRIGQSDPVTPGFYLNAIVDYAKYYTRILTAQEALDRYNASIRPDYLDLRFMDGQNKLKHWIEQDGKAWVKVPQIPANSSKTIDMYYGNYSALDVQDKDGLVAYYPLDGNSKDFAGGNHGTTSNVSYTTGIKGQCASFASNGYMSFTAINPVVSCNFWLNPSVINSKTILKGAGGSLVIVASSGGNIRLYNGGYYETSVPFTTGSWNMYSFVWTSSNNCAIYKNGIFQENSSCPVMYFEQLGDATTSFTGLLDEPRFYNRALTPDEIKSLYNQGLTTTISEKPEAVKGFVGKLFRMSSGWFVDVYDTMSISENMTALRSRIMSIYDSLTASEVAQILKGSAFAVYDILGVNEAISTTRSFVSNVYDNITLAESSTLRAKWTLIEKSVTTWTDKAKSTTNWTNKTKQ